MLGYALGDYPSDDAPGSPHDPGPGYDGGTPPIRPRTWYLIGAVSLIVVALAVSLVVFGG